MSLSVENSLSLRRPPIGPLENLKKKKLKSAPFLAKKFEEVENFTPSASGDQEDSLFKSGMKAAAPLSLLLSPSSNFQRSRLQIKKSTPINSKDKWSPETSLAIQEALNGFSPGDFETRFSKAHQKMTHYGIQPPDSSTMQALALCQIDWKDLVSHISDRRPYKQILNQQESKDLIEDRSKKALQENELSMESLSSSSSQIFQGMDLESQESVDDEFDIATPDFGICIPGFTRSDNQDVILSSLRKKNLKNPKASPIKAVYWSPPNLGIFTSFADFFRRRFSITEGRNVSIVVVKTETGSLLYTVASTSGPPGGTHAELLAIDSLPDTIRKSDQKILVFTERQPCCSRSNCNAKMKESYGDRLVVVYTQPYKTPLKSFLDRRSLDSIVFPTPLIGVNKEGVQESFTSQIDLSERQGLFQEGSLDLYNESNTSSESSLTQIQEEDFTQESCDSLTH